MQTEFLLSSIATFTASQQSALRRGSYKNVLDLWIYSPADIAKRCGIPLAVVEEMRDVARRALYKPPLRLSDVLAELGDDPSVFTTGDSTLDTLLGGSGVRTGMIWEISGEAASGKTQLALQLALTVQLSVANGGLSASAVYLTTYSSLPTPRLVEILSSHPKLTSELDISLDHIATLPISTTSSLLHTLTTSLPELLFERTGGPRPVRLLVIDAIADLFRDSARPSTSVLVERARTLSDVALALHALASSYALAIIVINHVTDVFDPSPNATDSNGQMLYAAQARIFGSAPDDPTKRAALGLSWANQINARIMLTRTERRRVLDRPHATKRRRIGASGDWDDGAILVRRLSVVFSSVGPPATANYIITAQGIEVLPDDLPPSHSHPRNAHMMGVGPGTTSVSESQLEDDALLDAAAARISSALTLSRDSALEGPSVANEDAEEQPTAHEADDGPPVDVEDDEESYWQGMDDIWDELAENMDANVDSL